MNLIHRRRHGGAGPTACRWLVAVTNDVGAAVDRADAADLSIAVSRGLHVLCVWVAVPLMFGRAANAYFRAR